MGCLSQNKLCTDTSNLDIEYTHPQMFYIIYHIIKIIIASFIFLRFKKTKVSVFLIVHSLFDILYYILEKFEHAESFVAWVFMSWSSWAYAYVWLNNILTELDDQNVSLFIHIIVSLLLFVIISDVPFNIENVNYICFMLYFVSACLSIQNKKIYFFVPLLFYSVSYIVGIYIHTVFGKGIEIFTLFVLVFVVRMYKGI